MNIYTRTVQRSPSKDGKKRPDLVWTVFETLNITLVVSNNKKAWRPEGLYDMLLRMQKFEVGDDVTPEEVEAFLEEIDILIPEMDWVIPTIPE